MQTLVTWHSIALLTTRCYVYMKVLRIPEHYIKKVVNANKRRFLHQMLIALHLLYYLTAFRENRFEANFLEAMIHRLYNVVNLILQIFHE